MANRYEFYPYHNASHPIIYGIAHFAVVQFLKYKYDLEIYGAQYLEPAGPRVYAGTHTRALDPAVKGSATKEPLPTMAKKELWTEARYKKFGVQIGQVISLVDAFPVRRGENDREAIRTANNHLNNNLSIGIFSQGTRNLDFDTLLNGAAKFSYSHNVDIQPLVIATYLDEEQEDVRELIRVIASPPLTPDKTKKPKDARNLLMEQLKGRFKQDYPRALAWAAHDAKYKDPSKRLGKVRRYA